MDPRFFRQYLNVLTEYGAANPAAAVGADGRKVFGAANAPKVDATIATPPAAKTTATVAVAPGTVAPANKTANVAVAATAPVASTNPIAPTY